MSIEWDDAFCTGEDEVDNQHRMIFEYVAKLEQHIEEGIDEAKFKQFLDFMGLYVKSHFLYEEICMRQHNCPVAAKNAEQHEQLLKAYGQFCQRFQREGFSEALARELSAVVQKWLVGHILKVDTHLKACMMNKASV
jgi:hemerythrin-like metal-binding protein